MGCSCVLQLNHDITVALNKFVYYEIVYKGKLGIKRRNFAAYYVRIYPFGFI